MWTREALEALLEKNPDDRDAFRVYADFLIESGDPLGEHVQLQRALGHFPSVTLVAQEAELRQRLFPAAITRASGWRWHEGFLRGLTVSAWSEFDPDQLRIALATPFCRFVRDLAFEFFDLAGASRWEAGLEALLAAAPRVTSLRLSFRDDLLPGFGVRHPTTLLRALPGHVERLTINTPVGVAELVEHLGLPRHLGRLSLLCLENGRLDPADVDALGLARSRVAPACVLEFPLTAGFSVETALSRAWPKRTLAAPAGIGVMVVSPREDAGRVLLLQEGVRASSRIGSDFGCELVLEGCGLSRVHAVVRAAAGGCTIKAMGQPGSAFLDGKVLGDEPVPMRHGSTVLLGRAALKVLERDVLHRWERERDAWAAGS